MHRWNHWCFTTGTHALQITIADVGFLGLHRSKERIEIAADGNDLELGLRLEQPPQAFADEKMVFREHHPDRHR